MKKGFTLISRACQGFTLVELLVVISIIAVLSTIGLTTFLGTQGKARDSVRKNDLATLATALALYQETNGEYITNTDPCQDQIANVLYTKTDFIKFISGSLPKDPKNQNYYCYESENGLKFKLTATLDDGTTTYTLSSEDFIAQASTPPTPSSPTSSSSPTSTSAPAPPTNSPPPFVGPAICSDFTITDTSSPFGTYETGESLFIIPKLTWDNISKVEVRYFQAPSPLSPPFTENGWKLLGTITRTPQYECLKYETGSCEDDNSCSCKDSSSKIVGYDITGPEEVCTKKSESGSCSEYTAAVKWSAPNYPGTYYLGMEAYNAQSQKVAGWNSGNTQGCTKATSIQAYPSSELAGGSCTSGKAVYPGSVKASVSSNNILLQWEVQNTAGSGADQAIAYRSTAPGFTPTSSNRIVTKLKKDSGSAQDIALDGSIQTKPIFYKVSAFNLKGETGVSEQTSVKAMNAVTCGLGNNTVAQPTNISISNDTIKWSYYRFVAVEGGVTKTANVSGWKVTNKTNGMVFDVKPSEVTSTNHPNTNFIYDRYDVSWHMPVKIAGSYSVQGYLNWCDGKVYYSSPNNASSAITSSTTAPTSVPGNVLTNVTASLSSDDNHPITISWTDTNTNEDGFYIYRSFDPLDINDTSKTVKNTTADTNSMQQWAYFRNLPTGKYYLAVKVSNSCGEGWSNMVSVDIGSVQGINTNFLDYLKVTFQNFFTK